MNENEIMVTEEVKEVTEEIVNTTSSGNSLKTATRIGLGVLAGAILYKYAVKPIVAKVKAKKGHRDKVKEVLNDIDESDVVDVEETEMENE